MQVNLSSFEAINKPVLVADSGQLNGKSFVVLKSYQERKDFSAGVGPGMFDGLGSGIVILGLLFTSTVAAAAVGIAAYNLKKSGIAFGIGLAGTILTTLVLKAIAPKF